MKFNHLNIPTHWQNYWTRYPEGHTILEALISWVSQVDSMVDNQNKLNDNVEQFRKEIDDFVGRFDERLQDEVTQTLNDWQTSGFLDVVISEALQWQLDDYIATNEQDKLSITAQLQQIHYNVLNEPKLPDETDDTGRIQRTIDKVGYNQTVFIPYREEPYKITGLKLKRNMTLKCDGNIELYGLQSIGLDLQSVLYCKVIGVNITLKDAQQIAIRIDKTPTGGYSQLNTFRNVTVEGSHILETTSLDIKNAYVNSFYDCFFFRTANGIKFGEVTNANNFYGCEVRGERTNENSRLAILLENAGDTNVFHGGAIENYRDGIRVNGGHFACLGTYVEGFGSNQRIWLENGSLTFKDCLFLALATIRGGDKFVFEDNRVSWATGVLNINYPVIRYENDVSTLLKTSGNTLPNDGVLTRYGMYNDGTGFKKRTKINEVSDEYHTIVTGRLTNNEVAVTGDGTEHVIKWGNANKDNDLRGEMNGPTGEFTPKYDGFYKLKAVVTLTGVGSTHQRAVLLVNSTDTSVVLKETSTNVRNPNGLMTIEGDVILFLRAGSKTTFMARVVGGDKVVTVDRISPTLGYTYYNITRVC